MGNGELGWACLAVVLAFIAGGIWALDGKGDQLKQSARAGVMVIDGTAYVLLPAKRGE